MSQVEGSYEAAAEYERNQKRLSGKPAADPGPAFAGREPAPPPGKAFGKMVDQFHRDTGAKTDGAKPDPQASEDPPVLPVLAKLVRLASERCEAEAKNYRDVAGSQASSAPASFMRTLGMVLSVAADTMDDLADA